MKTLTLFQNLKRNAISFVSGIFIFSIMVFQPGSVNAAAFTKGNLAVFQAAASANNTSGTILELNPSTSNQASAVNSYSIAVTTLRFSGSATSTGYMANSNDGTLLCFTGAYNSIDGVSNANTILSRGVGTLNNSYVFNVSTTYTGTSGNQTRCATTIDNINFFIGDQGGFYTNGASTASPTGNIRSIKSFGGTIYAFTASATAAPVGVISAATGGTYTGLAGLANGTSSCQDFYLISSGSNGTAFDVLYVLSTTSATAGTIAKYSLVSGSWTANGSYTTNFGGFGLCASYNSGSTNLYVTSGTGATTANKVYGLVDAAGYNTAINITTANNVTLYTAATGTILKGIAFAPQAPATISVAEGTTFNMAANVGSVATQAITVTGSGLSSNISLSFSGTDAGLFSIDNNPLNQTGGTATITFTPAINGTFSASLNLTSGATVQSITLNGSSSGYTALSKTGNSLNVTSENNKLIFTALSAEIVEVYNSVGQKLIHKQTIEGVNTIAVPAKGVVFVKVGNRLSKVIL